MATKMSAKKLQRLRKVSFGVACILSSQPAFHLLRSRIAMKRPLMVVASRKDEEDQWIRCMDQG